MYITDTNTVMLESSTPPMKRRPGRPKGSGKKQQTDLPVVTGEKIKRPVGRPRKDGLPAGSVGPRRPAKPRKSLVKTTDVPQLPPGVPFPGVSLRPMCELLFLYDHLTGVLSSASWGASLADRNAPSGIYFGPTPHVNDGWPYRAGISYRSQS